MSTRCWGICVSIAIFLLGGTAAAAQNADVNVVRDEVKAKLAKQRALIVAHPNDPQNWVDISYTLLDGGMGSEARMAVRRAAAMIPNDPLPWDAEGWVLRHDLIGVDFGKDCDYNGAVAAYRRARALDPNDDDVIRGLSDALEHSPDGTWYGNGSRLNESIDLLRELKAKEKGKFEVASEENLMMDLFYAGRYAEAVMEAKAQPSSPTRDGLLIASIAAAQSTSDAVHQADEIVGDPTRRSAALDMAASGLYNQQRYAQAAELLAASLPGSSDTRSAMGRIQIFKSLRLFSVKTLPTSDPRSPLQTWLVGIIDGSLAKGEMRNLYVTSAYATDDEWLQAVRGMQAVKGKMRSLSLQTGLPMTVLKDIVLQNLKVTEGPDVGPLQAVTAQIFGMAPTHALVLNEEGVYRLMPDWGDYGAVGREGMFLIKGERIAEAKALLDWELEQIPPPSAGDSLGGPPFRRVWTNSSVGGKEQMETALAVLQASSDRVPDEPGVVLELLTTARRHAMTEPERNALDQAIALVDLHIGYAMAAKKMTETLLAKEPDSMTALTLAGTADGMSNDWTAWDALLTARLAKKPANRALLLEKVKEQEWQGKMVEAQTTLQKILDSGNGLSADYNLYAWLSLFEGNVDTAAVQAAEQANVSELGKSFGALHTLACVYAMQGRTIEAREALLQAMKIGNLDEPNEAVWLGFGLIYEQYGARDDAHEAYEHVRKPEGLESPDSTYDLEQLRLKQLDAVKIP